jgi:branched-chain amino acid transport system permease protein
MSRLGVPLGATLCTVLGVILPEFSITIANYIGLYTLVTLGVVMLTGVVGVTSFGQAAFVGLSAYATAVISAQFGFSPWFGLLIALALTTAAAGVLGAVTLRLSGHYLPLSTIAWGISLYYVFGNLDILGGQTGFTDIPPIQFGSWPIQTGRQFYGLIWCSVLVALWLFANMLDSRVGRGMRAVKNSKQLAESFGIDTSRFRLLIFIYAAGLASISGWLYAHMLRFLNPTPFNLTMGIEYLFMAVIGGVTNIWGALLGASVVTVLKELLQNLLPLLVGQTGNFEVIVFGILVIILLQINRDKGLSSLLNFRLRPVPPLASIIGKGSLRARLGDDGANTALPLLKVERLSKAFGGLKALNAVSFEVKRQEIVAVIGPNGAGKSTLFNAITGLIKPDLGQVSLGSRVLTPARPREAIASGLARTFQHVRLVPELTVLENVMLGAHLRGCDGSLRAALRLNRLEEEQLRGEAARQLSRLGLADVAFERSTSLALGQQRLVEIARALCADPDVLLLDEPAAGLRRVEKESLARLIRSVRAEGISVLLVEHDMEFVMSLSDRIIVMNFGEKLLEGRPSDVRTDARVIEAYLGGVAA